MGPTCTNSLVFRVIAKSIFVFWTFHTLRRLYCTKSLCTQSTTGSTEFNQRGIDGLIDRKWPGRPRTLPIEKTQEHRQLICQPQQAGLTDWTGKKFYGYLRN